MHFVNFEQRSSTRNAQLDPRNDEQHDVACTMYGDPLIYDLQAIEAINTDQIATAIDRDLLRGGRATRRGTTGSDRSVAPAQRIPSASSRWSRLVHAALLTGVFSLTAALVVAL